MHTEEGTRLHFTTGLLPERRTIPTLRPLCRPAWLGLAWLRGATADRGDAFGDVVVSFCDYCM